MKERTLTCFPASEGLPSLPNAQDGKPSDSRRRMSFAPGCSLATGQELKTTETCETLGTSEPTLLQADFHVSHSASRPGSAEAKMITVTSGRKCCALLKSRSRLGCLLRTCLESSIWRSTKCYLIWKPSVTRQGRLLFRLVPLARRTGETEFGLWPTPRARDWKGQSQRGEHGPRDALLNAVISMFPTPTASRRSGLQTHGKNIVTGQLNPMWVEWLMGFPTGWTDLDRSATQ